MLIINDTGDIEEEYTVKKIIGASIRRGRRITLVKWVGYASLMWEPLENFAETAALDTFEAIYGDAETHDVGPGPTARTRRRGRGGERG